MRLWENDNYSRLSPAASLARHDAMIGEKPRCANDRDGYRTRNSTSPANVNRLAGSPIQPPNVKRVLI